MGFVKKEDFTSLSDKVSNNQTQLNTYIRFNADGIEIGKQESELKQDRQTANTLFFRIMMK